MNISLDNIKNLVIAGLLAYIILLQTCGGHSTSEPEVIVTTKTVTSLIKGTSDTVFVEVEKPIYIKVEVPVPVTVTHPTNTSVTLNEYTTEIKDSLLEGTITSQIDGVLVAQSFKYVPLYPKYITRVDTFKEVTTNKVIKKRWGVSIGGEVGAGATSFNLSPVVSLHTTKDYIYSYRYGLLDQTHNIVIQKRLTFRRKNLLKVL